MENKNNYLQLITALPTDKKPLYRATKRPKYTYLALLATALLCFVLGRDWIVWGIGIFLVAITAYSYFNVKESYAADIYSDFVVVYLEQEKDYCLIIKWDQILEWQVKPGNIGPDTVILRLDDESHVHIASYSAYGIMTQFNKKIRNKYYSDLPQGQKFRFRDLADMFKRKKEK